jgi:hypothetical protein
MNPHDTQRSVFDEHLRGLAGAEFAVPIDLILEASPERVADLRELTKRAMLIEIATLRTLA